MSHRSGRRSPRVPLPLALLAVAAAALLSLAFAARPAAAEVHQITSGALDWGVKASWRNYVGGAAATEGASVNADGTFRFPVESGTYDDQTRTTVLNFAGQVWFRSWWEYTAPGKWALDTTYRDLQLVISPTEQLLRGTHIGYDQSDPGGELHTDVDVVLATLDVENATPSFDGGQASWPDLVTLAGPGLRIYAAGAEIDPVSFSYAGPGGKPAVGERFATPGEVGLAEEAVHVTDWARENFTQSNVRAFADGDGSGISLVELRSTHNAQTALRFTRLRPGTLEPIGSPLVLDDYPVHNANRFYGRYFRVAHDPASGDLLFVKGGMGDDRLGVWLMRARWDADAQVFRIDRIGEVGAARVNGTSVTDVSIGTPVYNDVLDELAMVVADSASTDIYDRHALLRFRRGADDAWERVLSPLRAPDDGQWAGATTLTTPWGLSATGSGVTTGNAVAIARDGSYVFPSKTAAITQAGVRTNLPGAHVAVSGDTATPRYIPGTTAERHPGFGAYYGWTQATRSHDGSVLIHDSQWGMESFVRVDVVDGEAAVVGEVHRHDVDSLPPSQVATLGKTVAADPVRGWDWITDATDPDGWVLDAFRQIDGADTMFSRHRDGQFVAQPFGAPPVVAPDGDVLLLVVDTASTRTALRRYDLRGVLPTLEDEPSSRVASLDAGEQSETVTFRSTIAGGEPATRRTWQVRAAGTSRFADLDGEHGETLAVAATRADDGSRYRAVYDSPAGRIASATASLEVRFAPEVVNQPADLTVEAGQAATFVAMPAGNPLPAIDWQVRVGGIWQDLDLASGQFDVSGEHGGFLKVSDTDLDLSGTRFRARLRNRIAPGSDAWSVTFSRAATLTVVASTEEVVWFDGAGSTIDWGISERFRCYVTGSVARGDVTLAGPVARIPGTAPTGGSLCTGTNATNGLPWGTGGEAFRFGLAAPAFDGDEPVAPRYDPASGVLRVDLGGSVRFLGHRHHSPTGAAILDTTFSNLRVEANVKTGVGVIYADTVGSTMEDQTRVVTLLGVKLASFDASSLRLAPVDGRVRVDAVPTFLHEEGHAVLEYPVGEPLDALTLDLAVGTKPVRPVDPAPQPPVDVQPPVAPQPPATVPPAAQPPAAAPPAEGRRAVQPAVSVRRTRVLRGRTAIASLRCPAAATGPCRVAVARRIRLRGRGLTRAERALLRRGVRVVAPTRVRSGRGARVVLWLTAAQRRALRGTTLRGRVRVRVAVPGGRRATRTIRVVARVR